MTKKPYYGGAMWADRVSGNFELEKASMSEPSKEIEATSWLASEIERQNDVEIVGKLGIFLKPEQWTAVVVRLRSLSSRSPAPASKRPVAFRVQRVADKYWDLFANEDEAQSVAAVRGCEYQGLYARDGSPAPAERPCRLKGTDCIGDGTSTSVTCTYPSCVSSPAPAHKGGPYGGPNTAVDMLNVNDGSPISEAQKRRYAPADRAEIVEECAKVAEHAMRNEMPILEAIRSLASTPPDLGWIQGDRETIRERRIGDIRREIVEECAKYLEVLASISSFNCDQRTLRNAAAALRSLASGARHQPRCKSGSVGCGLAINCPPNKCEWTSEARQKE